MEEERSNIIKAITTPLGFFALSLLIVEGFLGITLGFTKVENSWFYFVGMIIGAGLFVLVVTLVFYLVLKKPRNLILGGKEYLDFKKDEFERKQYLDLYGDANAIPTLSEATTTSTVTSSQTTSIDINNIK